MSLKKALIRWIVIPLGALLVRGYARTLRIRVEGEDRVREHLAQRGGVIFASWHQRFYAGIDYFRRCAPAIMISQSADGEMIARIVRKLGWTPVRGSGAWSCRASRWVAGTSGPRSSTETPPKQRQY